MAETNNDASSRRLLHIIVLLVVQLIGTAVTLGVVYGELHQELEDQGTRITRLENSRLVGQDEFNALRDELRQDVRTIETAIFEEKGDLKQ